MAKEIERDTLKPSTTLQPSKLADMAIGEVQRPRSQTMERKNNYASNAKVFDENKVAQLKLDESFADVKRILRKIPMLSIYAPKLSDPSFDDDQPINL